MTENTLPPPKVRMLNSKIGRWLGVVPFFIFALLFLLLPSFRLLIGSFIDDQNHFTLSNMVQLFKVPTIRDAYWLSIRISAMTALGGGLLGFLLAYSITVGGLPRVVRSALITFSGVASIT